MIIKKSGMMDKKINLKLAIILPSIIIAGIIASPFVYAAVEPHIIIQQDPGQTTNPFTIQDNTSTDVFAIAPNGTIITGGQIDTVTRTEYAPFTYDASVGSPDSLDIVFGNYTTFPDSDVTTFAEPGAGVYQFTRTLTAADFPAGELQGFNYVMFNPVFSWQFHNADTVSRTLNMKFFVNGIEIEDATLTDAAVSGNYWYGVAGSLAACCSSPGTTYSDLSWRAEIGDTVQVKYWMSSGDTTNPVKLKRMSVYVQPAVLEVEAKRISFLNDDNWQSDGNYMNIYPDISDISPAPSLLQIRLQLGMQNSEFNTTEFFDYNNQQNLVQGDYLIIQGAQKTSGDHSTQRMYVPAIYLAQYIIIE